MKRLLTFIKTPEFLRIAAILFLAVVVRMLYLYEIYDNPFFRHLLIDESSYDRWARQIAAGEWLGKEIFYQDPLYPYFLGVIYSVIGRDFLWVRVIQLLLGSATCVFMYLLGKSFFDVRAGLVAGGIASLYKPFFYFEAMFLKTFLGIFLLCALLLMLVVARRRRWFLMWVAAGLVLGLLVLVRSNSLALAGGVAMWLFVTDSEGEKHRQKLTALGGFAVGLALIVSTVFARNYIVGKDVVVLTSQAGQNFFIGNNPWNDNGRYRPPIYIRPHPNYEQKDFRSWAARFVGRELSPSEASAFWFKRTFSYIAEEPRHWTGLMWTKFRLFWNWYEVPDNQNFYFFSQYSLLLRLPLPDFRVVAALGLCGMVLCLSQWRKALLPYMVVILYSATVILFYIFARYKLPVVPGLILFAAFALTALPGMIAERKYLRLGAAAVLTAGFLAFLSMNVTPRDYARDNANAYCRLGSVYLDEEKLDDALAAYEEASLIEPLYWAAHMGLGEIYERKGELTAALASYELANKLNPTNPDLHAKLAQIYFERKEYEKSAREFRITLKYEPNRPDLHRAIAAVYTNLGNEEKAQEHLQKFQELKASKDEG
jgi:tetratricopeptide (TPR) repeat protein